MIDSESPIRSDVARWFRPGALPGAGPGGATLPWPRRLTTAQWMLRGAAWLVVLLAFVLLLRYDVALMHWRFTLIRANPTGFLRQVLLGLRDFAQFVPITVAVVVVLLTDRRWVYFALTLLIAELLVVVVSQPIKHCLPRRRPCTAAIEIAEPRVQTLSAENTKVDDAVDAGDAVPAEKDYARLLAHLAPSETWRRPDGAGIQHVAKYQSFPSGHSAGAFALALVLAWFYPHLRWVFWALACGCAASRAIDAVHWPSDCLAGAVIGYLAGWIALHACVRVLPSAFQQRVQGHSSAHSERACSENVIRS